MTHLEKLREEIMKIDDMSERNTALHDVDSTCEAILRDVEGLRCEAKDCCDRDNCNNQLISFLFLKQILGGKDDN